MLHFYTIIYLYIYFKFKTNKMTLKENIEQMPLVGKIILAIVFIALVAKLVITYI